MRIFIASDVTLYREGLSECLSDRRNFEVVGSAGDVTLTWKRLSDLDPDVLLLDPAIPEGLQLSQQIYDSDLRCSVIVIGLGEVETEVLAWASAGISGFVTRGSDLTELAQTIEEVANGRWQSSPGTMSILLRHLARVSRGRTVMESPGHLTAREYQVVQMLEHGLSNKEIGRALDISVSTVKNHVHNILEKLDVRRRGEAAAWVHRQRRPHLSTDDSPLARVSDT